MALLRTASACGLLLIGAAPVSAQIDYRNLGDERPVATEDAYPVERHGFELLVPYRIEHERGGDVTHAIPLELAYGAPDNADLGVRAPLAGVARDAGNGTVWGLGGPDVFALYNFNTESLRLPALSLRSDVRLPVGALAGSAARVSLKAIATRSWGRSRVHLNVLRSFGPVRGLGRVEAPPRWRFGIAVDRTLFRQSVLLVGDVVAARVVTGAPLEITAAAGLRWQWTPTLVLDAGARRRLRRQVGPDYAFSVGLSHAFGVSWFMPTRAR